MKIPSTCVFLQKGKLCRYLAVLVVGNSCRWQFLSLPNFSESRHKLPVCFYLSPVVLNFHLFSLLLTVNSKTTENQTSEKTDTFVKSIFKPVARSIATQFAGTFIRMITSEIWVLLWPFLTNSSVNPSLSERTITTWFPEVQVCRTSSHKELMVLHRFKMC